MSPGAPPRTGTGPLGVPGAPLLPSCQLVATRLHPSEALDGLLSPCMPPPCPSGQTSRHGHPASTPGRPGRGPGIRQKLEKHRLETTLHKYAENTIPEQLRCGTVARCWRRAQPLGSEWRLDTVWGRLRAGTLLAWPPGQLQALALSAPALKPQILVNTRKGNLRDKLAFAVAPQGPA